MTSPVVLVALDPSDLEAQGHILDAAMAEAETRGAGLALVIVVEGMAHAGHGAAFAEMRHNLMREAAQRVDAWAESTAGAGKVETHVVHGDADEEILAMAGKLGAAAIVMGQRRKRAIDAILGSVASAVSQNAAVPVVLVPPVA